MIILLISASTFFVGLGVVTAVPCFSLNLQRKNTQKALETSVFNELWSNAKEIEAVPVPKTKEITSDLSIPKVSLPSQASNALLNANSFLSEKLFRQAILISKSLTRLSQEPKLVIEDKHNVDVISEQVLESLKLFQTLVESGRDMKEPCFELNRQFIILLAAIEDLQQSYSVETLNKLKINTSFLERKFSKPQAILSLDNKLK